MSIDKAPMLAEEMPAIAQTMQILANVIDDHEAKLNALLSKLEAAVLSPAVSPNSPSTGNDKDRSTSSPLNRMICDQIANLTDRIISTIDRLEI